MSYSSVFYLCRFHFIYTIRLENLHCFCFCFVLNCIDRAFNYFSEFVVKTIFVKYIVLPTKMVFCRFGSVKSIRAKVFLRNNISTQNSALKSGTYIHYIYIYRVYPGAARDSMQTQLGGTGQIHSGKPA